MPSMSKPIHQRVRSERAASEPHVLKALPRQAARGKKTRAKGKAQNGTHHAQAPGRGNTSQEKSQVEEPSGRAVLFTVQRDTDGKWKWDAYDRFGLKIATQDKCPDALQAFEEIIKWHAEELTEPVRP